MKKRTATIKPGNRRLKPPYPRDYSLRVFYGPGINPAIDRALVGIVGRSPDVSGHNLEWNFETKRSAVAAASRIINRVSVPEGRLLRKSGGAPLPILDTLAGFPRYRLSQKIRRVEVWEEAPRRILNVGFQARRSKAQ